MEETMRRMLEACLALAISVACGSSLARAQSPESEAILRTAVTHLHEGHPAQALEELRRGIKKDSKNCYLQHALGATYLELNQPAQAIAAYRKALELNPNYATARNDLGTALLQAGKTAEGKSELLRAFNEPMNARPDVTASNLGQAYLEDKDYANALTWFQTAAQKNKRMPQAYIGTARTLVAQGRMDDAIARLEEGISATAENVDVLFCLGETYYRAGRFGEARTQLERVTKKDPDGAAGRQAAELLQKLTR
jgi:type IV pilus assembly protein PilF